MQTLLSMLIILIFFPGIQCDPQLVQSEAVVVKPGASHTLTCKASGFTFSDYWMGWIRQMATGQFQWLSLIRGDSGEIHYHDIIKGRFTVSRDNGNSMLNLKMDNMKTEDTAVYFCARYTLTEGVQSDPQLVQSDSVVVKPGASHTLTCKGSGYTFSCCWINWIRPTADGQLQWLGYIASGGSTGYLDSVKGRFTFTRDDSNAMVTLKMDNMKPEDTAVYFCARHTVQFKVQTNQVPACLQAGKDIISMMFKVEDPEFGSSAILMPLIQ
ncbi:uncharacterized protein [Hyperolius riggenbachi]|uniref:uncharacterized protein n=1 Tax=Hyperolius riggenbachi TaxID=752182 RepID=UPI0035A2C326